MPSSLVKQLDTTIYVFNINPLVAICLVLAAASYKLCRLYRSRLASASNDWTYCNIEAVDALVRAATLRPLHRSEAIQTQSRRPPRGSKSNNDYSRGMILIIAPYSHLPFKPPLFNNND